MIFPIMYGWIVQIYGYSPAAAKVWEKLSSVSSAADLKVPFLSPIRCGLSSSFFHVTVVPAVTVKAAGVKAKLSISTVAELAAAVTAAAPAAVSSGRAAAKSAATPTAPSNRVIRRRRDAGFMVVNMGLLSSDERAVDQRGSALAADVVDRPDAEVFAQLIGGHLLHWPRSGSCAGRRLRKCRRIRGMEGDVALDLLNDLVDVAVEHGHRAEALHVAERAAGVLGSPAPLLVD